MKVTNFIENEDGSADMKVSMTPEETQKMIELGIITCIRMGLETDELLNNKVCCGGECEGNCNCTCVPEKD